MPEPTTTATLRAAAYTLRDVAGMACGSECRECNERIATALASIEQVATDLERPNGPASDPSARVREIESRAVADELDKIATGNGVTSGRIAQELHALADRLRAPLAPSAEPDEAAAARFIETQCVKAPHFGAGYLHDAEDDRPYDVDGVAYCGRCHLAMAAHSAGINAGEVPT